MGKYQDNPFRLMKMNLNDDDEDSSVLSASHSFSTAPRANKQVPQTTSISQTAPAPKEIKLGQATARKYYHSYVYSICDTPDYWLNYRMATEHIVGELEMMSMEGKDMYMFIRGETSYKVFYNREVTKDPRPSLGTHYIIEEGEKWFLDVD